MMILQSTYSNCKLLTVLSNTRTVVFGFCSSKKEVESDLQILIILEFQAIT